MVKAAASPILQLIRRAVEDRRVRDLPDQELLQRFHAQLDEATFHALLCRHGPMVLDVCRGVLGNETDAEDAFQATFLVLARKAGSIRKTVSVGSWLHRVAHRTALKARAQSATRQKHEARAPVRAASEVDDLSWREVRQVLHEELGRLPERYRAPLVLCYLEGATQEAAAVQLGLPRGTLRERLERGRALLRARLVRRGLGLAALLAAAGWPAANASAGVPLSVLVSTAKAGAGIAAGQMAAGLVSTKVAALTEGVLKAMFLTKLKIAALVLLTVALAGTGSGVFAYRTLAAGQPDGAPAVAAVQATNAADAALIAKLIDQLGSDRFAEREKAAKELDQLGAPALEAVRKAAKTDDPERKRRAEELVRKIEKRALEASLLMPKRVHLVYKDTPLAEALADFQMQSGYALTLSDQDGKLTGRKVTLDTGEVTFWQAFDQFCRAAGLVEAPPPPLYRPASRTAPQPPTPSPAAKPGGGLVLTDGKVLTLPADDRTAVRVRARRVASTAEGQILLALEISGEPRLPRLQAVAVQITKVVDDQGQNLEQVFRDRRIPYSLTSTKSPRSNQDAGFIEVHLGKGAKASTSLTEISGTVTIRALAGDQPASKSVTVDVPFTLQNVPLR